MSANQCLFCKESPAYHYIGGGLWVCFEALCGMTGFGKGCNSHGRLEATSSNGSEDGGDPVAGGEDSGVATDTNGRGSE